MGGNLYKYDSMFNLQTFTGAEVTDVNTFFFSIL